MMRTNVSRLLMTAISLLVCTISFAQWKPAGERIKTKWAEQIDPNNVLAEYPRPIMEREPESTPIIAGFKLPDSDKVEGGLDFSLPDGRSVGRIKGVEFHNVNIKVKGGHDAKDAQLTPPEIGVGKFNIRDLKVQPSWGFWARHVDGLLIKNCHIETEIIDGRYPVLLDNVLNAEIINLMIGEGSTSQHEAVMRR